MKTTIKFGKNKKLTTFTQENLDEYLKNNEETADLSYKDLSNLTFKDYTLRQINFTGSKLNNTQFINCNLSESVFLFCVFDMTQFINTTADYCNFNDTDLSKISYTNSSFFKSKINNKTIIDKSQELYEQLIEKNDFNPETDETPLFHSGRGYSGVRLDGGMKEVLQRIGEANPYSKIAQDFGKKDKITSTIRNTIIEKDKKTGGQVIIGE